MAAHIVDKGSLVYDPEDYERFKKEQRLEAETKTETQSPPKPQK